MCNWADLLLAAKEQVTSLSYSFWMSKIGENPLGFAHPLDSTLWVDAEPRWDTEPGKSIRVVITISTGSVFQFVQPTIDFVVDP